MNSILSGYVLSAVFMIIILAIIAARSFTAVTKKTSRNYSLLLIGGTALYVITDCVFIACHLSGGLTVSQWSIVAFVFYIVYTALPFIWHLFVRNYVGSTLGKLVRILELIPIVILLVMIIMTPSTGALYYFDNNGMYARGQLYTIYSYLNFFYYADSIIDMLIILIRKNEQKERYAIRAAMISLVVLIGAFVNGSVIPMGTIFPFMPFCQVIVTMLAFYFIATKDSDMAKDEQQQIIQESLEKAQEASKAKTDFLSRMSHDIRTPMNAIINLNELALKEPVSDTVRDYLNKMMISSKFLLGLINDILDMSRIESGGLVLNKSNLTRSEFLSTVETVISPLMKEKDINFHTELNPGEYTISVDKLRFNQIFFNLLSNAVKFTPEGGDIWFNVENLETEDGKLKIKFVVRDNGIGMSEEFQQHLFEPFSQEHSDLSNATKGTGLGLSIVKNLVDSMDGTISVKSKLGEGSEFTVLLSVDIVAREDKGASSSSITSSSSSSSSSSLDGLHVLLVEDNEINTYVARIILENIGCKITEATNGQEAVDTFAASELNTYGVILMDVRMPIMDGLEATKTIRALDRPDAASIPIIAMTADAFDDERMRTLEVGMNYHLTKPIDPKELQDTLKLCCGTK